MQVQCGSPNGEAHGRLRHTLCPAVAQVNAPVADPELGAHQTRSKGERSEGHIPARRHLLPSRSEWFTHSRSTILTRELGTVREDHQCGCADELLIGQESAGPNSLILRFALALNTASCNTVEYDIRHVWEGIETRCSLVAGNEAQAQTCR
jgi:hypothetical protein